MAKTAKKAGGGKAKKVAALRHAGARRANIPTAETQSYMQDEELTPKPKLYPRNPDLDPQLVWKGKDEQDAAPLAVDTVPIYIQEKIQPKAIIDDLRRQKAARDDAGAQEPDLFGDFNGIAIEDKLDFYQHQQNWSNRMILGDALLVMNSLAEKEKLRGRVQMIYIDPPYGIKFGSNWQVSTRQRNIKDGKIEATSREPDVIKAFRDTWELGIHSYLSYLRDRFVVARDLLTERGSIFVQIGEENVQLVRLLLDEVFGRDNAVVTIVAKKKGGQRSSLLDPVNDYILWYSRSPRKSGLVKFHALFEPRHIDHDTVDEFSMVEMPDGAQISISELQAPNDKLVDYRLAPESLIADFPGSRLFRAWPITNGGERRNQNDPVTFQGRSIPPPSGRCWSHTVSTDDGSTPGMQRVLWANRLLASRNALDFKRYLDDFEFKTMSNWWDGLGGASKPIYVVQTNEELVKRCILLTTDPGDLIFDPTCGSGTTAFVAEQWGRRWITIDTSRVALALARTRLMAARFPYYLLVDSPEGQRKEAELLRRPIAERPISGDIRQGFVYRRAVHITSGSIANNAEIDIIHDKWQRTMEPLRAELNKLLGKTLQEWQFPREADKGWNANACETHAAWWEARRARQKEIDESIARNADTEYLYDRPYEDKSVVRVTGPFTVESLSPHRVLPTDAEDEAILDALDQEAIERGETPLSQPKRTQAPKGEDDFVRVVLENLKSAGVQNTKKKERLVFTELKPWAGGKYIHAEGRYEEGGKSRRAAICIGPEYGTVSYALVRDAAREAKDLFDVLVVCGFAFEPNIGDDTMSLGRLIVLKARMNQDLHMAEHLKKTGAGNLFVVFGEPDIDVAKLKDGQVQVTIKGVDVFDPTTGEVRSGGTDDIACWFIDTDYDEESFFVRHAYFLGAKDPYERLKKTLKAEMRGARFIAPPADGFLSPNPARSRSRSSTTTATRF